MRPHQSFDFTQTWTNSDLDTAFIEAGIQARYDVKEDLYVTAGYRYLDIDYDKGDEREHEREHDEMSRLARESYQDR